ncbi:MAG: CIA30 family protein [Wenzhouxiangella sp.]
MAHSTLAGAALVLLLGALAITTTGASEEPMLIDDFASRDGTAAIGTRWRGFTDRVMGGRSDMQAGYVDGPSGPALRLRGQVRLDNNGGFIQTRVPLQAEGGDFDASDYRGIALRVRGAPGPYYLHLRTRHTWRPWQYYRATIDPGPEWRDLVIPFSAFEGRSIQRELDLTALRTLGVVAYGEAFEADIEVARIELVR